MRSGHVDEVTHPFLLGAQIAHCRFRCFDLERDPVDHLKATFFERANFLRIV
jgi:hypothetical protein